MDLLEEAVLGIVAQVELFAELLDELKWFVVLEDFYLFHVFAVEFDLQHADWLFYSWREVGGRLPSLVMMRARASVVIAK